MNRTHRDVFLSYRKRRREAVLRKMAAMRAAKERKRLLLGPPEPKPMLERWYPLELGVRDKRCGVEVWTDFVSVRDSSRRLSVIQREYVPGVIR